MWTKETFQRVSVGFYINVKVICYQLELGNVPVGKAVSIIRERLREDETLGDRTLLSPEWVAELLEMCLKSTYFQLWRKLL